jgi:uncharacterized membrane protein YraQ (UPF0718 family)
MLVRIVCSLIIAFVIGVIVYELRNGKLLGRNWKAYTKREDNPMLFWSTVALQMFAALIIVGAMVLTLMSLKN